VVTEYIIRYLFLPFVTIIEYINTKNILRKNFWKSGFQGWNTIIFFVVEMVFIKKIYLDF